MKKGAEWNLFNLRENFFRKSFVMIFLLFLFFFWFLCSSVFFFPKSNLFFRFSWDVWKMWNDECVTGSLSLIPFKGAFDKPTHHTATPISFPNWRRRKKNCFGKGSSHCVYTVCYAILLLYIILSLSRLSYLLFFALSIWFFSVSSV